MQSILLGRAMGQAQSKTAVLWFCSEPDWGSCTAQAGKQNILIEKQSPLTPPCMHSAAREGLAGLCWYLVIKMFWKFLHSTLEIHQGVWSRRPHPAHVSSHVTSHPLEVLLWSTALLLLMQGAKRQNSGSIHDPAKREMVLTLWLQQRLCFPSCVLRSRAYGGSSTCESRGRTEQMGDAGHSLPLQPSAFSSYL